MSSARQETEFVNRELSFELATFFFGTFHDNLHLKHMVDSPYSKVEYILWIAESVTIPGQYWFTFNIIFPYVNVVNNSIFFYDRHACMETIQMVPNVIESY